jgi:hypothetical protein
MGGKKKNAPKQGQEEEANSATQAETSPAKTQDESVVNQVLEQVQSKLLNLLNSS